MSKFSKVLNIANNRTTSLYSNKLVLYTDKPHSFIVGDYVYISGGFYENYKKINEYIKNPSGYPYDYNDLKGYKILDVLDFIQYPDSTTPQSLGGNYGIVLDINANNVPPSSPYECIYPYGTKGNPLGLKNLGNTGVLYDKPFNDNIGDENRHYKTIYIFTGGAYKTFHKEDNITNIISGSNIDSYEDPSDISQGTCTHSIGSRFNNNIVMINSNSKTNEYNGDNNGNNSTYTEDMKIHVSSNGLNYFELINSSFEFPTNHSILIETLNSYDDKFDTCNFYDNRPVHKSNIDVYYTKATIVNSIVGQSYEKGNLSFLSDSTLNTESNFNNSTIFNCNIGEKTILNSTHNHIINNSNIYNHTKINPMGITNIDEYKITFTVPIVEYHKNGEFTFEDSKKLVFNGITYNLDAYNIPYDYINDAYYKYKFMPDYIADISVSANYNIGIYEVVISFVQEDNKKFYSHDINDYYIQPIIYNLNENPLDEKYSFINNVDISNSTIGGAIGNNSFIENCTIEHGFYNSTNKDYKNKHIFNNYYDGTNYNIIHLLRNSIFYNNDDVSSIGVHNELKYTIVNNFSELYTTLIENSYLRSPNEQLDKPYENGLTVLSWNNIDSVMIKNTLGNSLFLYNAVVTEKSKFINTNWYNCSIYDDELSSNDKIVYETAELTTLDGNIDFIKMPTFLASPNDMNKVQTNTDSKKYSYVDENFVDELYSPFITEISEDNAYTIEFIDSFIRNMRTITPPHITKVEYDLGYIKKDITDKHIINPNIINIKANYAYNARIGYDAADNKKVDMVGTPFNLAHYYNLDDETYSYITVTDISYGVSKPNSSTPNQDGFDYFNDKYVVLSKIYDQYEPETSNETPTASKTKEKTKALNNNYTYSPVEFIAGNNDITPATDDVTGLKPYMVSELFIDENNETIHPIFKDSVELHAEKWINTKLDSDLYLSIFNGIRTKPSILDNITKNISDPSLELPFKNDILVNIEFNTSANSYVADVNNTESTPSIIEDGINSIRLNFNPLFNFVRAMPDELEAFVPQSLYEVENVYVENIDSGDKIVYHVRDIDQYIINLGIKYTSLNMQHDIRFNDLNLFNIGLDYNKLYKFTFDIWVTPLYNYHDTLAMETYIGGTSYNDEEYFKITGGYAYKVRVHTYVQAGITSYYLINEQTPEEFVTTSDNNKKIIIM